MPITRPLAAACAIGVAFALLAGVPVGVAAAPAPGTVTLAPGPEACIDLPLSPLELNPISCWITGPTSVVAAGIDPRTGGGAVVVVREQQKLHATLSSALGLRITGVANGTACVRDRVGQATSVDLESGATRSGCAPTTGILPRTGVQAAATLPPGSTASTAPPASTSYYVYGAYLPQCGQGATTGCPLFNAGAAQTAAGLVVLDFGAPCYNPNTLVYGTQLFNTGECTPDDQLVPLAQAWIRGYESANPAGTAVTILGLGSSNSVTGALPPTYSLTPTQMFASGYSWFTNVVRPVATGTTGAAPLTFWAASDIEESSDGNWYDPTTSRPWVDGYQSAVGPVSGAKCASSTSFQMVDYGDSHPGVNGWSSGDIYYVAWGAGLSCALPEIYYSGNENGWVQLNQWAALNHVAQISFTGVMSEDGANGSMSAANSWTTLANATGQSPPYLTVITGGAAPATPFMAPTNVAAVPGATSSTVSWSAPQLDGGHHITGYTITPYAGAVAQTPTTVSGSTPPVTAVLSGLTNGTSYTFTVFATNSLGVTGPESAHSNAVTPSDAYPYTASSTSQYTLTNSDGVNWSDMDAQTLRLRVTPSRDGTAVLTANADLWTANAGINQDLGIDVNGKLVAWKESGGYGGTYSPNAAFVQATYHVTHGQPYTVTLRWKTNKPQGSGTIYAGAGTGPFSPTRLTVTIPPAAAVNAVSGTGQYRLAANDGTTWVPVDPSLGETVTAPAGSVALIGGNADLWTAAPGYNQDLGISIDGAAPIAWKESGGFAGTYSPNAAFVLGTASLPAGSHSISLVWKANRAVPANTVFAGAGQNLYSPSTLTVEWLPSSSVNDVSGSGQYTLRSSDGIAWTPVDSSLTMTIAPSTPCLALLSGNADLWTSSAGVNQDLGITVTPHDAVSYPAGLAGWKESGGYAGTFSPNAAFVQSVYALNSGTTYTVTLSWKTNSSSAGAAHAGAGQAPSYSPTRLTAVLNCG